MGGAALAEAAPAVRASRAPIKGEDDPSHLRNLSSQDLPLWPGRAFATVAAVTQTVNDQQPPLLRPMMSDPRASLLAQVGPRGKQSRYRASATLTPQCGALAARDLSQIPAARGDQPSAVRLLKLDMSGSVYGLT